MSLTKGTWPSLESLFKGRDRAKAAAPPAAAPGPISDIATVSDWSPGCYAFLAYWQSLRDGQPMPTTERFLDDCSPAFAGVIYILEITDTGPVVRLQGTQLEQAWSRDLTGQDFFPGRSARFKACAGANMRKVLEHPCGHLVRSTYATSKGRKITSDWIQLPLAVRPGRAPRIVGAVFQPATHNFAETAIHHFELHRLAWLDAGCGVPAEPPTPLEE